jgi:hypothetical protein
MLQIVAGGLPSGGERMNGSRKALALMFAMLLTTSVWAQKPKHESTGNSPALHRLYQDYNVEYFAARLPDAIVNITTDKNPGWAALTTPPSSKQDRYQITISTSWLPAPRSQFEALLHEMCHVSVEQHGGEFEEHGPKWQACMLRLAEKGAFRFAW